MCKKGKKRYRSVTIWIVIVSIIIFGAWLLFCSDLYFKPQNPMSSVTKQDAIVFYGAIIGAASAAWLGWLALQQSHRQQQDTDYFEKKRIALDGDLNTIILGVKALMEAQYNQKYQLLLVFHHATIHDGVLSVAYSSLGTIHPTKIMSIVCHLNLCDDRNTPLLPENSEYEFIPVQLDETQENLYCYIEIPLLQGDTTNNRLVHRINEVGHQSVKLDMAVVFGGDENFQIPNLPVPFQDSFERRFITKNVKDNPFRCDLMFESDNISL